MTTPHKTDNLLIVLSGPSGVGKTTIIRRLLEHPEVGPTLRFSVSATTRPPRPGESDGVSYYFISNEEFDRRVAADEFIEWAGVHTARYGTPRAELKLAGDRGQDLLLEIDVQGAAAIKQKFPDALLIFLSISDAELRRRLEHRPSALPPDELRREIELRLNNAKKEMLQSEKYDYNVINDDIGEAVENIAAIVKERRKTKISG